MHTVYSNINNVSVYALQVFLGAKPGYIVCECKHLSAFAGNLLVAPNKVDLFNLKMFLNVFQNPIVVSLLIAFWCTFSLMTVWARRKDGKDSDKVNALILFPFPIVRVIIVLIA